MPRDLILNSLEIQRFRCFRELRIGHLGRVNLIVGKNNVGKSTVLEALRLFARPDTISDLIEILVSRNEISRTGFEVRDLVRVQPIPVESLFYGRQTARGVGGAIVIGPVESPTETLQISVEIHDQSFNINLNKISDPFQRASDDMVVKVFRRIQWLVFQVGSAARTFPAGIQTIQGLSAGVSPEGMASPKVEALAEPIREIALCCVGPDGLGQEAIGGLWDKVSLSPAERDVIEILRIISPEFDRVALKAPDDLTREGRSNHAAGARIPFVRVEGFDEPIPLRALGDGVNRLFGLALALVHAKGGLLLIDEIENGIHYSVQADLWRLVFETATRLNVQVFATTHSYDCIKAFEVAARESEDEGVLVRLARKGDRTLVGEFDERELEIAVEGEIEVR